MAGDVHKAVVSSLKCTLAGTKITGKHDVELHISVHIEEESTPSFMDLVKHGVIQFKNFGVQVCERKVSKGCKNCRKDVVCQDRELELVVGISDPSIVCQECNGDNPPQTSSKKRGRKPKKAKILLKENEDNNSDLSSTNPVVVLEKLNDNDIKPDNLDSTFVSPVPEVITPQTMSKSPVTLGQFETPVKPSSKSLPMTESPLNTVRRSSRSTKSRFRRTYLDETKISPVTKTDTTENLQISRSPPEEKRESSVTASQRQKSAPKESKVQKSKQHSKPSKRKNTVSDKLPLDLSESESDGIDYFDDEDNDPDFVLDNNNVNLSDDERPSENNLDTRGVIKNEKGEPTDIVVMEDVEDALQIKNENSTVVGDSSILAEDTAGNKVPPEGFEIHMVEVPEVHQEEFSCPVCPKSYILNRYLTRHLQKAGKEPVLCDICGAKFHYQKDVDQHKLAHSGINRYMCAVCHRSFPNLSQANKHVKKHLPPHERPFICPTCGKGFTEQHSLLEHSYIHAEVKPYECTKCEAKFAARYLLHAHMKYHSNRTYRCYTCNRVYKVFASLKEHLYVYKDHYTKDEPEPIEKVPSIVAEEAPKKKEKKRKSVREQKLNAVKKLKKNLMEKSSTPDPADDAQEEQEISDDDSRKDSIDTRDLSFQKDCLDLVGFVEPAEETTPGTVKESIKGEDEVTTDDEKESKSQTYFLKSKHGMNAKYSCKICFRRYLQKGTLHKHYRKCGKVCYPCNQCKAKFHSKEDRAQHKLLHSGKHPYQCKVCFKSFVCLSKCRRHTATHLPTTYRPFVCQVCGKGFPFQGELDRHARIHNEANPNKCVECSMVFRTTSSLKRHMDGHKGKLYRCDTCNKEYKYLSSLKEHLKHFNHSSNALKVKPKPSVETVKVAKTYKNKGETQVCDVCGITCLSASALGAHKRRHKTEGSEIVNPEVMKKFALQKHKERIESQKARLKSRNSGTYGDFECDVCGQHFNLKASLRRHKSIKHGICKHQCHVCQKKFFLPSELERHLLSHFGDKSFQCHLCPKSFYHEFGLNRHLKIHIAKEKLAHGCSYCGKRFTEACYLREHVRRHTGERPFVCDICGKGFISKNVLKGHKVSHEPKSHECTECGKCFAHPSNLSAHMRLHQDSNCTYLCDDCGKSFNSKSGLTRHQVKHTGVRKHKCQQPGCDKTFFFRQELKNHLRSHEDNRPFQCDLCGKSFKYQSSFSNHLNFHKNLPPLTCEICNKVFYLASRLKRHMQLHLGERNLECDECGKKFITKSDLAYHKRQHMESFKCQECGKVFCLETRLKSHIKIHVGPERVQCPRCNIFYKDLLYLQTSHLKSCDPKKVCSICGRRFKNIRKLQSHIGLHSGKRPHECDECGTAYAKVEQLQKHKERHRKKRYPCPHCEKRFDWVWDLKKHKLLHEKKETEMKKVEEYKYKLLLQQEQEELVNEQELAASTSFQVIAHQDQVLLQTTAHSDQEQQTQDILAQAAAGITIVHDHGIQVLEDGTVVQYVQEVTDGDQTYSQVVELDASSLIHDQSVPASTEQVILTTLDASQLAAHGGNEILMVAMIPDHE